MIPINVLRGKPRSTAYLLKHYGCDWRDELPPEIVWGVDDHGRCFYWILPERHTRQYEARIGKLELREIHSEQ